MRFLLLMLLAALVAAVLPVQAAVNGRLGQHVGHPLLAALISFLVGTGLLIIVLLFTTPGWPSLPDGRSLGQTPWPLLTGGALGAVFVTIVLMLVPRIGPANLVAATVAGQLMMSVLIEHYGWVWAPRYPVNSTRVLGCLLLLVGMFLIQSRPRGAAPPVSTSPSGRPSSVAAGSVPPLGDPATDLMTIDPQS